MTTPVVSLTEVQILTALRSYIRTLVPSTVEVIRGLDNRVPEPAGADFIVMTPILRERLETTIDGYGQDYEVLTFGSLANIPSVGDTLVNGTSTAIGVVTAVSGLNITVGSLTKYYFAINDVVTNSTTSQSVGTITSVSYGGKSALMPTKVTIQVDVHGPNSADYAQTISTLFRDEYATDQFASYGFDVQPLYADNPKQVPFLNAEQQIEERWSIDVAVQANPVIDVPMQYMDAAAVSIISVDATYPPA